MKIPWGKKVLIFGAKDKAAHRAELRTRAREIARLAKAVKAPSTAPIDYANEFSDFLTVFSHKESPFTSDISARDRIISLTSLLDEELRWCITLKMSASRGSIPSRTAIDAVFEGTNVLASFGDKISFSSAFGLLPNELKGDIGILKEIRNQFAAHTFLPISFDDPEISSRCQNLQSKMRVGGKEFENENERKFVGSVYTIVITLIYVAFLLIDEHKIVSASADLIIKTATARWNAIWKQLGLSELETPTSSPEKSA